MLKQNLDLKQNLYTEFEIKGLKDFRLEHIFENGQCFRWNALNDEKTEYVGIVSDGVYILKEEKIYNSDNNLSENSANNLLNEEYIDLKVITNKKEAEAKQILNEYFDLEFDYGKIKSEYIKLNESLKEAVYFAKGLRVLKQPKLEMIISYIISANNNIKRIKKIIEELAAKYGEKIVLKNKVYYAFPTLEKLKTITLQDFIDLKVGFRAKRLFETIKVLSYEYIESLDELSDEKLSEELLKLSGVGPKVANCIMLFGYNRLESFPIDVWVKRVMQEVFFDNMEVSNLQINKVAEKLPKKGLAQQYLFYWIRVGG